MNITNRSLYAPAMLTVHNPCNWQASISRRQTAIWISMENHNFLVSNSSDSAMVYKNVFKVFVDILVFFFLLFLKRIRKICRAFKLIIYIYNVVIFTIHIHSLYNSHSINFVHLALDVRWLISFQFVNTD